MSYVSARSSKAAGRRDPAVCTFDSCAAPLGDNPGPTSTHRAGAEPCSAEPVVAVSSVNLVYGDAELVAESPSGTGGAIRDVLDALRVGRVVIIPVPVEGPDRDATDGLDPVRELRAL